MKGIRNIGGGRQDYGEESPDLNPYSWSYQKQVRIQGGTVTYNSSAPQTICQLQVPYDESVLAYVSISPDQNMNYVSPNVNGAIYNSQGKAMVCLCELKLGAEQGVLSFNFDLSMGRLLRIPLVVNTLTISGRFVEVPQVISDEPPFWSTMDFNAPPREHLTGYLTPDAPPFRRPDFPQVENVGYGVNVPGEFYEARNIPVLVTGFILRGPLGNNVLPHLTRRVQVIRVHRQSAPIPIAWGATHIAIRGRQADFTFLVQNNHGNVSEITQTVIDSMDPVEIPDNATSLILHNRMDRNQDFEVIYYLGF